MYSFIFILCWFIGKVVRLVKYKTKYFVEFKCVMHIFRQVQYIYCPAFTNNGGRLSTYIYSQVMIIFHFGRFV